MAGTQTTRRHRLTDDKPGRSGDPESGGVGPPGVKAGVRTGSESAGDPDAYVAGDPAALVPVSQWPEEMKSLQKPPHTVNYALVDKVIVEPRDNAPDRIRIEGLFSMETLGGGDASYEPPQRVSLLGGSENRVGLADVGGGGGVTPGGSLLCVQQFRDHHSPASRRRDSWCAGSECAMGTCGSIGRAHGIPSTHRYDRCASDADLRIATREGVA
jgi:hypothetical protein